MRGKLSGRKQRSMEICESKCSSFANMFHFVKISFGKGSSQPKGVKSEFTRVREVLVD
jgi:hypothetical protein